jgi:hypothetical protein
MKNIIIFLAVIITVRIGMANEALDFTDFQKMDVFYETTFTDNFKDDWVVEMESAPGSSVAVKNNRLLLNTKAGVTVWYKKPLSGDYVISYKRGFILEKGINDRLSDLNQFWMARDPMQQNLFTRKGAFAEYDPLDLYYMGIGGNHNSTTRFRRYDGKGNRHLLKEYLDKNELLIADHEYHIVTEVKESFTRVWVDGKLWFEHKLDKPVTSGHFGFRSTFSHQYIKDFTIYKNSDVTAP